MSLLPLCVAATAEPPIREGFLYYHTYCYPLVIAALSAKRVCMHAWSMERLSLLCYVSSPPHSHTHVNTCMNMAATTAGGTAEAREEQGRRMEKKEGEQGEEGRIWVS